MSRQDKAGEGFEVAIDRAESMAELIGVLVLRARREVDIIDAFKYLTHVIPMAYILARDKRVTNIFRAIIHETNSIVSTALDVDVHLDLAECLRRAHREVRETLKNSNYGEYKVSMEKLAWYLTFISTTAIAKRSQDRHTL
jgi:glycyl-tRNA synthetase beta subunit